MKLLDAFDTAMNEFDRRVHRVRPNQWSSPTPCTEWSVRDLVNHLTSEHLWAPWLLRGATMAEVGGRFDGDVLGEDPVAAWERAAADSQEAFHSDTAPDARVDTSGGPIPVAEYEWQMTSDLTVHAWDLARGIGDDDTLDEELVLAVHEHIEPQIGHWQGLGIFEPPVKVPASARPQDRLVALLGREP